MMFELSNALSCPGSGSSNSGRRWLLPMKMLSELVTDSPQPYLLRGVTRNLYSPPAFRLKASKLLMGDMPSYKDEQKH